MCKNNYIRKLHLYLQLYFNTFILKINFKNKSILMELFSKKIPCILFLYCSISYSQQAVIPAGGNATGSSGNVSFTVGQVNYTSNSSSNYSVSQGVQQPFEISILSVDKQFPTTIQLKAYPNPTSDFITLDIDNLDIEGLQYTLIDINGKIIIEEALMQQQTIINFTSIPSSTYFIKVTVKDKNVKTFKIVKK